MFYSQQQEDKILYEKYLNYKNGFFIEIGAMDGVIFSNTKFFEDELNWKGILVEPTQQYNNLIINRPNCYNFNYAVSEERGDVDFLGYAAIGGILNTMNDIHKKNWNLINLTPFKVKSVPFHEITRDIKIEKVDLFSIDVEGGELSVLKTFDWNIPVYIILIELDNNNKEKDNKCREYLLNKGFLFDMRIGLDEVWIKNNYNL
jgi:FkbM family methyltransferase